VRPGGSANDNGSGGPRPPRRVSAKGAAGGAAQPLPPRRRSIAPPPQAPSYAPKAAPKATPRRTAGPASSTAPRTPKATPPAHGPATASAAGQRAGSGTRWKAAPKEPAQAAQAAIPTGRRGKKKKVGLNGEKLGFFNYPRKQYRGIHRYLPSWKFVGACCLIVIAAGVGLFWWVYQSVDLPDTAAANALAQTTRVYYSDGKTEMGEFSAQNREVVALSTLPDYVGQAFVSAEDRTFWSNSGVDPVALTRAFINNLRGRPRQGGSTITQEYVERYLVGKTTTDIKGKVREAILALKVTRAKDKSAILESYLNTIYLGRSAYGVQTAAQAYFGVDAKNLTVSQAALLAGILPAPTDYDPATSLTKATARWNYVLDGMVKGGYITQSARAAMSFPATITPKVSNVYSGTKGYLLQMVRQEMTTKGGMSEQKLDSGGYKIVTTINKTWQAAAVKAVKALPSDQPDGLHVAAVSVDPASGAIKALYGGADYMTRQQNAVTQDVAQVGSTFKPLALTAALESGDYGLSDGFPGYSPMTIPLDNGKTWKVENEYNTSYGWSSLLRATEDSINTVFAQLNEKIGPELTRAAAVKAGLPSNTLGLTSDMSNVLGTASPHPLDMARVYATLADQGVRHDTYIVQSATAPTGKTVYSGANKGVRVFDKDVMAEVTYALSQVVQYGTGTEAQNIGRPAAGKTGTTEEHQAVWFAGYTPQMTTVVAMYQNGPDGQVVQLTPFGGRTEMSGGDMPCDVWVDIMNAEMKGMTVEDFPDRTYLKGDKGSVYGYSSSPKASFGPATSGSSKKASAKASASATKGPAGGATTAPAQTAPAQPGGGGGGTGGATATGEPAPTGGASAGGGGASGSAQARAGG
jgi:membrane peptidoglycan carboxypeptidase